MPRRPDRTPHRLALFLGLVMLLVAGFAAQRSVHLCRAQNAIVATAQSCCEDTAAAHSCCAPGTCHCAAAKKRAVHETHAGDRHAGDRHAGDRHAGEPGPAARDHGCDSGCCVAIDVSVENGPLPKAMGFDGHLSPIAALPPSFAPRPVRADARRTVPATGPPRPDPQLALRRTTLLLL